LPYLSTPKERNIIHLRYHNIQTEQNITNKVSLMKQTLNILNYQHQVIKLCLVNISASMQIRGR